MKRFSVRQQMNVGANTEASLRKVGRLFLLVTCVSILMGSKLGVCQGNDEESPPQVSSRSRWSFDLPGFIILLPGGIYEHRDRENIPPPKPVGIVLICKNLTQGQPSRDNYWDNFEPVLGQTVRFQVLVRCSDGRWYTHGRWNPHRIRDPYTRQEIYFDTTGWSVVAAGYEIEVPRDGTPFALPSPRPWWCPSPGEPLDFDLRFDAVYEWRWSTAASSPTIELRLNGRHEVDYEQTFSSVYTPLGSTERYYMYNLLETPIQNWYVEHVWNYIGENEAQRRGFRNDYPGMRIVSARFRFSHRNRYNPNADFDVELYAGPIPGVKPSPEVLNRDNFLNNQGWRVDRQSEYNQYVGNRTSYGIRTVRINGTNRTFFLGSHFTPIYVRPNQLFHLDKCDAFRSFASRELVNCALSMLGIPYEWGGKGYSAHLGLYSPGYKMRASVTEHDNEVEGDRGFGLDCSGFVYQSVWRANTISVALSLNPHYYRWINGSNAYNFGVYAAIRTSDPINRDNAAPGDLLCLTGDGGNHVAIFLRRVREIGDNGRVIYYYRVVHAIGAIRNRPGEYDLGNIVRMEKWNQRTFESYEVYRLRE